MRPPVILSRVIARLRGLARRRAAHAEFDEELQFHLAQAIEEHVARGATPDQARRLALRDLGGLTATTQAVRDVRTLSLDVLWRDVRYAIRALAATPGFTLVALLVLALGIGATTAIVSLVDAVVIRDLPFDQSDRLVVIGERALDEEPATPFGADPQYAATRRTTPQTFLDWRERQDALSGMAAVAYAEVSVQGDADVLPRPLRAQRVTMEFLDVLRVRPMLGRNFSSSDEFAGGPRVALISHHLWQEHFSGRADVIGLPLHTQRVVYEVVGVMPADFTYPVDTYLLGSREPVHVWLPYGFSTEDRIRGTDYGYNLHVVGRLRDEVSLDVARQRMQALAATLAATHPRWYEGRATTVELLHEFLTRRVRAWMGLLLGAAACVLLIACVNLATLLLVRGTSRSKELAVRAALGASGRDLTRMLLVESLVLALCGAALGVGLAWWGLDVLRVWIPDEIARADQMRLDLRVLGVMSLATVVTGVSVGLAPVLQLVRPSGSRRLHRSHRSTASGRSTWLRSALVTTEVALAVVLLVGAALFLSSYSHVTGIALGLDPHEVQALQVRVAELPDDPALAARRNRMLLERVRQRVESLPGIEHAALLGGGLPLRGDLRTVDFEIPGRDMRGTDIDLNQISPRYFETLRVPVLRGRAFTDADTDSAARVVILNEVAARRYFGGDSALGRVVRIDGDRTVVGIVGSVRHDGPETDWRTQAFVPMAQSRVFGATVVVRTAAGVGPDVLPAIRRAIASEFAGLPVRVDEGTLTGYAERLVVRRRFTMQVVGAFGVLALAIAVVGIYGVMAYAVTQRTREIGIRMAIGARAAAVIRTVLGGSMTSVLLGLVVGAVVASSLAPLVRGFLFGVTPHDPRVYVGAAAVLLIAALVAALAPAWRATRVDPVTALRAE